MLSTNKKLYIKISLAFLLTHSITFAASVSDIENIEKNLIKTETELLTPELRLDELFAERSKYDGIGGWFQNSKKKALDAEIEKEQEKVKTLTNELKDLNNQVQEMVYQVAQSYESKKDYEKAIEYYLKVANRTDTVRQRIAVCFKAKKNYMQAVKWYLEMKRSDTVLIEVVDCCKLDGKDKEAIYWLFEILEPLNDNSAETTAFKLIEEYKYQNLKVDYPNFFERLSKIYISKAFNNYGNNPTQANADYKKAVALLCEETSAHESSISLKIVNSYQDNYTEALEILAKQKEAAERNFQDKINEANRDIREAEHRLRRAQDDAERHYRNTLTNAENSLNHANKRYSEIMAKPEATQQEKDYAKRQVDSAQRELTRVRNSRHEIVRDYLRPYERELESAKREKYNLERDKIQIIENYISPYKNKAENAKKLLQMVKTLHNNNF